MPSGRVIHSRCTSLTCTALRRKAEWVSAHRWKSMRFLLMDQKCHMFCTAPKLRRRPGKPTRHLMNTLVRIFLGYTYGLLNETPLSHRRGRRKRKGGCTESSSFKTCSQSRAQMWLATFIPKQPYNLDYFLGVCLTLLRMRGIPKILDTLPKAPLK